MKYDKMQYVMLETATISNKDILYNERIKALIENDALPDISKQNKGFGLMLFYYIKKMGLNQTIFANMCGVNKGLISKVIRGVVFSQKVVTYYLDNCSKQPLSDLKAIIDGSAFEILFNSMEFTDIQKMVVGD